MQHPDRNISLGRGPASFIAAVIVISCVAIAAPAALAQSGSRADGEDHLVLFFSAEGPLWIKLRLTGSEYGIDAVRKRYATVLIQSVDADKDGFADAGEAPQLPLSGRPGSRGERLGDRWIAFDSSPHDGKLSPTELLTEIDSQLGPRFTTRRKPPLLFQSVQLLPRLDLDGDRQISESELAQGTTTLRQFDFDDDGTFSPAELQPFPQSMVDAAMEQAPGSDDQPFVVFDASADPTELVSRLLSQYGGGKGLPQNRSGVSEFAFAELDRDDDGILDEDELPALLARPRPAAEISINLSQGRVSVERVQRGSERVEVLPIENSRRLSLRLGTESVEFSARDNRYEASDQINLLKIRFLQGDRDRNGYMEPAEFPSLMGLEATFEDVDTDGDGKVFLEELDRFVRIDSYLAQCAVEMEVEPVEKPLFRILDVNLDRRLAAQEFVSGRLRLQEFDVNGDAILDAQELDVLRRFRVRFAFVVPPAVRPDRSAQMAANRRMPVMNRNSSSGPDWFQNMDRNQDGEITWREFLGPREAFDRLDADGSGWIDAAEAAESTSSTVAD